MEVTCSSCNKKINVPDEKVPKNASFSFNCPGCKTKITVAPKGDSAAPASKPKASDAASYPSGEIFGPDSDVPGAMVCHSSPEPFKKILESMGYGVHAVNQHITAINNLRFNNYKIVIITKGFEEIAHDGDSIYETLKSMTMDTRRKMVVVYVAPGIKSYDAMEAFAHSVNMVSTPEEGAKDGFKDHLEEVIKEHKRFYKVFIDSLAAAGKS